MNRSLLTLLVLAVVGGAIGYAFYRQYQARALLNNQLQVLNTVLRADNSAAADAANYAVQGIHVAVVKNQKQPREMAVLAAAENLDVRADSLAAFLATCADDLLVATRNINSQPSLPHPNETHTVTQLLGPGTKLHHSMRQQLSSYATGLRTLHPAARLNLTEPDVGGLPVVVALARLAQLEDDIRTAEINALGHVSSQISNSRLKQRLVAFASAESNQVAPGNLYKARLYLTTALGPLPGVIQMRCNGQPVPVDSNSMGHVRFVAPNQLGPTTWTGTIGFQVGGRDTLFRVRVPYRVARP